MTPPRKRARIDTNRAMWRARLEEIEASIKEAQDRRLSAWTKHERALIQHWEHIIEQREEARDRHLDRDTATYSGE